MFYGTKVKLRSGLTERQRLVTNSRDHHGNNIVSLTFSIKNEIGWPVCNCTLHERSASHCLRLYKQILFLSEACNFCLWLLMKLGLKSS